MGEQTVKEQDKAMGLDPIIAQARRRFKAGMEWERDARRLALEDYKFANGDSDNNYQWPDHIVQDRSGPDSERPTLTINKVRQHNLQVTNDAKKNKPGIAIKAVGNAATAESAQIWEGLCRHVEAQSNAPAVYDKATDFMVQTGVGYWRLKTDYCNERNFDQEIFICQLRNPWAVLLDCDAKEPDQSDANWGFISDDVPREMFEDKYPRFAGEMDDQTPGDGDDLDWATQDHIRVAEYYRRVTTPDVLYAYTPEGAQGPIFVKDSELPKELKLQVVGSPLTKKRPIMRSKVEWFLLVGNKVVERKEWPGQIIPIVRITGEETIIENKLDRKGHTRYLKDAQRMYNYNSSASVEYGALQTKTPWLASAEAVENYEDDWNASNIHNKSVLLYNALDDAGNAIPPPQRISPPVSMPAALQGMQTAAMEMMMVSGQYQASMGEQGNERSAKAITERQRQGETATYHYVDALALGVRKTGKIILEIAPKIYDTQRVLTILQENGKGIDVMIDPTAAQAYQIEQQKDNAAVVRMFNPAIGQYEVMVDVGPSYGTRREEAFNAFMQMLGQAPQLIPVLGDFLLQSGDFPLAEEAAERLRRMVPPMALGQGPSPQEQMLQQKVQSLTVMLQKLMEEKSVDGIKLKGKDQQKVIDMFNAITARLKVVGEQSMNDAQIKELVKQTLEEAFNTPIDAVGEASAPDLAQMALPSQLALPMDQPPVAGAKQGPDGRWYQKDYNLNRQYRAVG